MLKYRRRGSGILLFKLRFYLLFPPKLEFLWLYLLQLTEDSAITIFSKWKRWNWTLTCPLPTVQNSHGRNGRFSLLEHLPPLFPFFCLRLMCYKIASTFCHDVRLTLVPEHRIFYKCAPPLTINNDCCVDGLDGGPALHVAGVLAFVDVPHSVHNQDAVKNVGLWILLVNTLHHRTSFPCL